MSKSGYQRAFEDYTSDLVQAEQHQRRAVELGHDLTLELKGDGTWAFHELTLDSALNVADPSSILLTIDDLGHGLTPAGTWPTGDRLQLLFNQLYESLDHLGIDWIGG